LEVEQTNLFYITWVFQSMEEPTPTENAHEEHPPEPPKKVLRRMGHFGVGTGMGLLGTIQVLKSEARDLRLAGVAHLLKSSEEEFKLHLSTYLSGTSARTHTDAAGDPYLVKNGEVIPAFGGMMSAMTGTHAVQFNPDVCLNLHIDLIEKLCLSHNLQDDGLPEVFLDSRDGQKVHKSGGFQEAYHHINVDAIRFSKMEQDRCIFGMKPADYVKILGNAGTRLKDACKRKLEELFGKSMQVVFRECHALFHWNDHSFFTYHQDTKGTVAIIVNLSPGETTFHVAGFSEAVMNGPGSAHILPTQAYHRSGKATKRAIKLVFFFDAKPPVDPIDVDKKVDFCNDDTHFMHGTSQPPTKPEPAD
jgi:hypothetical protein